jgi:hypothetical protein
MERCRNDFVGAPALPEWRTGNEEISDYRDGDRGAWGLRDDAEDADLPRRIAGRGRPALSAAAGASAASASAAAASDDVPGRIDGPGRHRLSGPAASTAAELGGRARLSISLVARRWLDGAGAARPPFRSFESVYLALASARGRALSTNHGIFAGKPSWIRG